MKEQNINTVESKITQLQDKIDLIEAETITNRKGTFKFFRVIEKRSGVSSSIGRFKDKIKKATNIRCMGRKKKMSLNYISNT